MITKKTPEEKHRDATQKLLDTCEKLKLDSQTKKTAQKIYQTYPNYWYSKPLMGASIYLALYKNNHPPIPQNTIADHLETDGNSINRMSTMIQEKENLDISDWKHIEGYEERFYVTPQNTQKIIDTLTQEIKKRNGYIIKIKIITQKN